MGESTEGVSVGVLGVAVLGVVGAGATAVRLGAWGTWGGMLGFGCGADGDGVRGPRLLGGAAAGGSCGARAACVFHVNHDVGRVTIGM